MSGRFKMPKPVFSTDDIEHFKELMKFKNPSNELDEPVNQIHILEGSSVDLKDEVSKSDALADISYCYDWGQSSGDDTSEMVIYGNFGSPVVQKWLLEQMTYEDSFLWRVARGRMDLNYQLRAADDLQAGHA